MTNNANKVYKHKLRYNYFHDIIRWKKIIELGGVAKSGGWHICLTYLF